MKFKTITGKTRAANIQKYLVNWDGECRGKSKWGKFQSEVKQFLKPHWENNIVCEEFPCFGTKVANSKTLRLDLLNLTRGIAIEVNGIQHSEFTEFFHGDRHGFLSQIERDSRKLEWCELNEYELLYIQPEDELSVTFFKEKFDLIL